jgi:hypothetical protein
MKIRLFASASFVAALTAAAFAQAPHPAPGVKYAQISPTDMKEWLSYLASDELQGRQIYTEGYGLASAYVADHLKSWGVKPLGEGGTYFQTVKSRGYKVTRNSSVTVGDKTFKHGDHVTMPVSGGKQTLSFSGAEFVGYGMAPDLEGKNLKDKLVVVMPNLAPPPPGGRGRVVGGGPAVMVTRGAKAIVTFAPAPAPTEAEQALTQAQDALQKATAAVQQAQQDLQAQRGGRAGFPGGGRGGRGAPPPSDVTTVQRIDALTPPQFTGDETFFEALFANAPVKFADLKAKALKGEPLAGATLSARTSISIDNAYETVSEQLSHNVVGIVEGSDPKLKDTYVLFGAHLDHIGYNQAGGGAQPTPTSCRQRGEAATAAVKAAGKTIQNPGRQGGQGGQGRGAAPAANPIPFEQRDIISNGADDDGSGSTSLLAVAKAFATGPKPKRSIVFVWHTGEEGGLLGSRYNADFPIVPLEKTQVQLNMDMVGRDDCDNVEGDYTNSVFVIGADRISTDLHNVIVEQNQTLQKPLTLDYEMNDPLDPESVYTRSDHYSYAAKGIPIAFFTTGLHKDYHKVSDTVDKIIFPKMARIAQLVYETGFSIANTDKTLERDNLGPRTGFGTKPAVISKGGKAQSTSQQK